MAIVVRVAVVEATTGTILQVQNIYGLPGLFLVGPEQGLAVVNSHSEINRLTDSEIMANWQYDPVKYRFVPKT